jgi:hypothetical protein
MYRDHLFIIEGDVNWMYECIWVFGRGVCVCVCVCVCVIYVSKKFIEFTITLSPPWLYVNCFSCHLAPNTTFHPIIDALSTYPNPCVIFHLGL